MTASCNRDRLHDAVCRDTRHKCCLLKVSPGNPSGRENASRRVVGLSRRRCPESFSTARSINEADTFSHSLTRDFFEAGVFTTTRGERRVR